MYKSFLVFICMACIIPISYLIYFKKNKNKDYRVRTRATKIGVFICSVILVGLFVVAFVLMSKRANQLAVNLIGAAIITCVSWIMALLFRKKEDA